jgi:peptidoglycan/LPS O-acetylase OafA/YrhL
MIIWAIPFLSFYPGCHNGLLAVLFILLILAVAEKNTNVFFFYPLVFLGEISYGIYLLQRPVHYNVADQLNMKFFHLHQTPLYDTYIGILLIISIFSYYFIGRSSLKN